MNLQIFQLDLEKSEEAEIKLPTSVGSSKKQGSSRNTSSALLTMPKLLTVDHNKLWKILQEMGTADCLTCLLRNMYAVQEATVRMGHGTTDWFQIGKGVRQGCILSPCLFNWYTEYIMRKCWAGWSTSWNQDCQEKYQQPQICRWQHPYSRKRKRTKELLDASERGEWKSWLKTQHSEN